MVTLMPAATPSSVTVTDLMVMEMVVVTAVVMGATTESDAAAGTARFGADAFDLATGSPGTLLDDQHPQHDWHHCCAHCRAHLPSAPASGSRGTMRTTSLLSRHRRATNRFGCHLATLLSLLSLLTQLVYHRIAA